MCYCLLNHSSYWTLKLLLILYHYQHCCVITLVCMVCLWEWLNEWIFQASRSRNVMLFLIDFNYLFFFLAVPHSLHDLRSPTKDWTWTTTGKVLSSNHLCVISCFSRIQLFATLWTVACQGLVSIGFSRQESWSGLPCPPPGDLPNSGWKPGLLHLLHCSQILYCWVTREAPLTTGSQGIP